MKLAMKLIEQFQHQTVCSTCKANRPCSGKPVEVDRLLLVWEKAPSMRPIWKGSISFGLVYIPVAVYPATREEKFSFRQLRSSDLSPIRYKKVAEANSKEVPAE